MRRKAIVGVLSLLVLLIVAVLGLLWGTLSASLPTLDGNLEAAGLQRPVEVERDALGIPTIRGENRKDIAYATGFVHAQDRFFQMDTFRRRAAESSPNSSGKRLYQPIVRRAFTVSGIEPITNLMPSTKTKRNFSKPTQMEQIRGCVSSRQSLLSTIFSALNPENGHPRIASSSSTRWRWICKIGRDTLSLPWTRLRGLCRKKLLNFSLPGSPPGTHRSTEVNAAPNHPSRMKMISIFELRRTGYRRGQSRILGFPSRIYWDETFSRLDPRAGVTAGL